MAKVIFEGVKSLKPKEDRTLIAIAGPPGSGKSTVAEIVADLMNENLMKTSLVPMDGFHFDNKTLERENLFDRKGAPETFDVKGFKQLIKKLRYKKNLTIPQILDKQKKNIEKNKKELKNLENIYKSMRNRNRKARVMRQINILKDKI